MDAIIKTKFNIMDKVYVSEYYDDWRIDKNGYTIKDIIVYIKNKPLVKYVIEDKDGFQSTYSEKLLFSTYGECEQWVKEERNKYNDSKNRA